MTETYYDGLTPYYKFIYPDWDKSVYRQAEVLDNVIKEFIGETSNTVLDVACGIGTQSIGLAELGYKVTSSDLSSVEVEQARQEALRRGVQIEFQVVDMRQVWETYQRQFDVLIACDNSVPHLLGNDEILLAFRQFYQCTKSGGCCIITVRDYAQQERKDQQKQMYPRLIHQTDSRQIVMFDVWDFDGDYYEITTYIVDDIGKSTAQTQVLRGGKYYCVEISTLEKLFIADC
jgi:cyclopropane fatty-acyl-phospholipid synthase-like methyltransferase